MVFISQLKICPFCSHFLYVYSQLILMNHDRYGIKISFVAFIIPWLYSMKQKLKPERPGMPFMEYDGPCQILNSFVLTLERKKIWTWHKL
jgi:hypothetical protein